MDKLMELKGTTGIIVAYDDRVVISRKGAFGFTSQKGFSGDRTYFYQDISAVEYKKPGLTNGYIKFILAGTMETKAATGLFKSSTASAQDQNTVILRAFKKETPKQSDELYNLIMENISKSKKPSNTVVTQSSNLDELKKLAELRDSGIINEKEFEEQKLKLLNQLKS